MKYPYDGKTAKDIVEKYEDDNNKLIITYLNGTTQSIQLTKENLERIRNIMLKQAEERRDTDKEKRLSFSCSLLDFAIGGLSASILYCIFELIFQDKDIASKMATGSLMAINSIIMVFGGREIRVTKKEIDDIRKYDIYLNYRMDFEEYKERLELYEGVEYKKPIDINTIDEYSYEDLIQLRNNVKNIKSYDNFCAIAETNIMKI